MGLQPPFARFSPVPPGDLVFLPAPLGDVVLLSTFLASLVVLAVQQAVLLIGTAWALPLFVVGPSI